MGKFHQTLLDDEALSYIKSGKELIAEELGKKVSYSEVIKRYVGQEVRMRRIRADVRDYVRNYSFVLSLDERIAGIVLFGSYARGSETKESDIDLFVIFNGTLYEGLKLFSTVDRNLEPLRQDIVRRGIYTYVSPLIVNLEELYEFKPIYFDIMDYGIVLFQRKDTISSLYRWLGSMNHRRNFLLGKEVLNWTE